MSGRAAPARVSLASDHDLATLLRWGSIITFLLIQLVTAVWWASALSTTVQQHDKTLSEAGISRLAAENERTKEKLAEMTAKYNRLLEYEGVVQLYESKIRELLVASGVQSRDIPAPPQLPQD